MFLPKIIENSKTLKTHQFFIFFHPKHQKKPRETQVFFNETFLKVPKFHSKILQKPRCFQDFGMKSAKHQWFSKILAQNKRNIISNVFAKNNKKFKNIKNPLVFDIFPSKIFKNPRETQVISMEASSRIQDFIQKSCKNLGVFKILG